VFVCVCVRAGIHACCILIGGKYMSGCMVNDTSDCMHITSIACFVFPVFWG